MSNVPNLRFPEFEEEWENVKIKDYGTIVTGNTPPTKDIDNYGNDYLWASPADLGVSKFITETKTLLSEKGFKKTRKLPQGSILVTCIGIIGKMGMAIKEMATNQQINSIIINANFDSNFVYYAVSSQIPKYQSAVSQQVLPIISKSVFEELDNYSTDIEEQNKIGRFLSLLDDRISTQSQIIEELKTQKVVLRNKLFNQITKTEETEQIINLLNYEQPTKYIVANTEYSTDTSLTPVLTANKAFILGYTDEDLGIYHKGDCIIFDDFTMDLKYVDFPFKVKSSAIKILTTKQGVNLRFIYEYFSFLNLASGEHKRHYISEIEPLCISLPEIDVQNYIANLFSAIDKKLETEKQILKKYTEQKKYLLANMFI